MTIEKKLLGVSPSGFKVDDVFSATAYTGNGGTQSIDNGLDLSSDGGLIWLVSRTPATPSQIVDTERGVTSVFDPLGQYTTASPTASGVTSFNLDGFSLGPTNSAKTNVSNRTYISWAWKKEPAFFDIQTYSGNSVSGRTISHDLDAPVDMIWVSAKTGLSYPGISVYHKGLTNDTDVLEWNRYAPRANATGWFNGTPPTSSVFTLGNDNRTNGSGKTYIAYLFGSVDGISKCGSYVGNGSNNGTRVIDCGFENGTRMVLFKRIDAGMQNSSYIIFDGARGINAGNDPFKYLDYAGNEVTNKDAIDSHSSGFIVNNVSGTWENETLLNVNNGKYVFYAIANA